MALRAVLATRAAAASASSASPATAARIAVRCASNAAKPPAPVVKPATAAQPAAGAKPAQAKPAQSTLPPAPGTTETKQGVGLVGIAVPVLALAATVAAYVAHREGYFDAVLKSGGESGGKAAPAAAVARGAPPAAAPAVVPPAAASDSTTSATAAAVMPLASGLAKAEKADRSAAPAAAAPAAAPVTKAPVAPPAAAPATKAAATAATASAAAPAPAAAAAPAPAPAAPRPKPIADEGPHLDAALALARRAVAEKAAPAQSVSKQAAMPAPAPAAPRAESVPLAPATALEAAKAGAAAWKAEQVTAMLRREATDAAATEVATLNAAELRERVLALNNELSTRAKWEAVHLLEMLEKNDARWSALFEAYAREASEDAKRAREAEVKVIKARMEDEFTAAVERERRTAEDRAAAEANVRFRQATQQLFDRVGEETDARIEELRKLQVRVGAVDEALKARGSYESAAQRLTRIALCTQALLLALNRPEPATQEVAALRVAAGDDPVVTRALAKLPAEVHSARGVPTMANLQTRFWVVAEAARVAAVVPEGTGAVGQAFGAATSALLIDKRPRSMDEYLSSPSATTAAAKAPAPAAAAETHAEAPVLASAITSTWRAVVGAVSSLLPGSAAPGGSAPSSPLPAEVSQTAKQAVATVKELTDSAKELSSDISRTRTVVDTAAAQVAAGDLTAAIGTLHELGGSAGDVVSDWVAAARLRVAADQAAAIARTRAVLLTAALY